MRSGLLRSGVVTSSATLLSRILGMARDIVIASVLGAGMSSDVFFFANRIPNFFRRLFAEGAFAQSFVPVMSAEKQQGDRSSLRELIGKSAGTLGGIVLLVTLLGMLLSPVLTALFGWGWFQAHLEGQSDGEKYVEASELLRITFPYLFFITLTALCSSVLNVFGKFGIPAMTPCILNITLIAAVFIFGRGSADPNLVLAWGMVAGGVFQLLFEIPFVCKLGMLVKPSFSWNHRGVKKIRQLMIPAVIGVSASQLNLFISTLLASFLATGAISYLYYSDRLLEFPIGIFAVAVSTVILPALSKSHAASDPESYTRTLDWGVRLVLVLGIPSMCGLIALREPVLRVIFMRGAFTSQNVLLSASSLLASASGLCAIMLTRVLVQGFAARQDTKTPVRCSLISIASNIVFNLILIKPLGYVGLALSTALAAYVNAALLLILLHRKAIYTPSLRTVVFILKTAIAGLVMALAVRAISPENEEWFSMSTPSSILYLAFCVTAGALIYAAALLLSGIRPSELKSA